MSYDDDVRDFLSKPENLKPALEICERIQNVKDYLEKSFWECMEEAARSSLEEQGITTWSARLAAEEGGTASMKNPYYGVRLYPIPLQPLAVCPCLEKENARLFYGLSLIPVQASYPNPLPDEINLLRGRLQEDFRMKREVNHWLGWDWIQTNVASSDFFVRVAEDKSLENELAVYLVKLLVNCREEIERANGALLKAKAS